MITNGTEPVAIAGVMGGANSEVKDDTTTVLIEVSIFCRHQLFVKDQKTHGLRSEASARFEKGVDPARVREAGERAAH